MAHDILENSGFAADRKLNIVGTNPIKHDGWDKVTGVLAKRVVAAALERARANG